MDLMQELVSVEEEKDSLRQKIAEIGDGASKIADIPTKEDSKPQKVSASGVRKRANATDTESTTNTEVKKDQ